MSFPKSDSTSSISEPDQNVDEVFLLLDEVAGDGPCNDMPCRSCQQTPSYRFTWKQRHDFESSVWLCVQCGASWIEKAAPGQEIGPPPILSECQGGLAGGERPRLEIIPEPRFQELLQRQGYGSTALPWDTLYRIIHSLGYRKTGGTYELPKSNPPGTNGGE